MGSKVRLLREELQLLQEPGSYVGEVIKQMGKKKVLVKVNPEGKYVVDIDKAIDISLCTPNTRVALRNDSYVLHKILPTKVSFDRNEQLIEMFVLNRWIRSSVS